MPTREQIKERAKMTFRNNYGISVAVYLIALVLIFAASYTVIGSVLVAIPIELGLICHFLMVFQGGTPDVSLMFQTGFGGNFGRKIGGYLWMSLFSFLWTLLFVIPGIIKSYSYAMTPYILAVYPEVTATNALKLSMRIMDGHKAELFVFHLSFLGWALLSSLTCGILMVLYVGPYMSTALSGYYCELMDLSVKSGIVTADELSGR